ERRDNMRQRLFGLTVTVESPSKRIFAVNVLADRVLSCCELHSLLVVDVMVSVVVDQHAIVEDLVEHVETRDEFNQLALEFGVVLTAHLCVDVGQRRRVFGKRNYGDSTTIEVRRRVKLQFSCGYLAENCKRAMIVRKGLERGLA